MKYSSGSGKKKRTRHPRWLLFFMLLTILGIAGFQAYWLRDNYNREKQTLEIKTNAAFRQTILRLQASKLKLESMDLQVDSMMQRPMAVRVKKRDRNQRNDQGRVSGVTVSTTKEPVITMVNLLQERIREIDLPDSIQYPNGQVIMRGLKDSLRRAADSLHRFFANPAF
ncbi:MAG: hypothetical protein EOO01_17875, partial [Chitinophagaceae bacterium]